MTDTTNNTKMLNFMNRDVKEFNVFKAKIRAYASAKGENCAKAFHNAAIEPDATKKAAHR